jgi:hypothetical protein
MHYGSFLYNFLKTFLKINYKTTRIYIYFGVNSRKKVILKKCRICSHLAEFFPQIYSQTVLGGNSQNSGDQCLFCHMLKSSLIDLKFSEGVPKNILCTGKCSSGRSV